MIEFIYDESVSRVWILILYTNGWSSPIQLYTIHLFKLSHPSIPDDINTSNYHDIIPHNLAGSPDDTYLHRSTNGSYYRTPYIQPYFDDISLHGYIELSDQHITELTKPACVSLNLGRRMTHNRNCWSCIRTKPLTVPSSWYFHQENSNSSRSTWIVMVWMRLIL